MAEDDELVVLLEEVEDGSQAPHVMVEDVVVVFLLEVDDGSQAPHAIVVVVATVVVVVFETGSTTDDELQSPHPGAAAERPLSPATVRTWKRMLAEMG